MTNIIKFPGSKEHDDEEFIDNKLLEYAHTVCGTCENNSFYIRVSDTEDIYESIICTKCGNEIFVNLKPINGPNYRI